MNAVADLIQDVLHRPWRSLGERLARLTAIEAVGSMRLPTLAFIRWVATAGQLFTVLVVHFSFGIELPILWLVLVIAATAVSNILFFGRGGDNRLLTGRFAFAILIFDVLQLAMLLGLTGGLQNPFSLLLLLPVALAATILDRTATIVVTGLALLVITILAGLDVPLPWTDGVMALPRLYIAAIWVALNVAIILVASYVWQLAFDSRRHADAFSATQLVLAREQQMSALGAQAAAVAHMMGTPLATINIVAKELVRELPNDHPLAEDARDLLAEVLRCREILSTLGSSKDDTQHARFTASPLSSMLESIAEPYVRPEVDIEVHVEIAEGGAEPVVDFGTEVRHSLANIIENAASFARSQVDIHLRCDAAFTVISIEDDGPGFSPEVLDRLGQPYISTREGNGGLGLGIFIANSLLARTGAKLHFGNTNKGAQVRIHWPADALGQATEAADGRIDNL